MCVILCLYGFLYAPGENVCVRVSKLSDVDVFKCLIFSHTAVSVFFVHSHNRIHSIQRQPLCLNAYTRDKLVYCFLECGISFNVFVTVWSVNGFPTMNKFTLVFVCFSLFYWTHCSTLACVRAFIRLNLFYICTVVNMDDMPKMQCYHRSKAKTSNPHFERATNGNAFAGEFDEYRIITVVINKRKRIRHTHTWASLGTSSNKLHSVQRFFFVFKWYIYAVVVWVSWQSTFSNSGIHPTIF